MASDKQREISARFNLEETAVISTYWREMMETAHQAMIYKDFSTSTNGNFVALTDWTQGNHYSCRNHRFAKDQQLNTL